MSRARMVRRWVAKGCRRPAWRMSAGTKRWWSKARALRRRLMRDYMNPKEATK